jgi:hypothetical protein
MGAILLHNGIRCVCKAFAEMRGFGGAGQGHRYQRRPSFLNVSYWDKALFNARDPLSCTTCMRATARLVVVRGSCSNALLGFVCLVLRLYVWITLVVPTIEDVARVYTSPPRSHTSSSKHGISNRLPFLLDQPWHHRDFVTAWLQGYWVLIKLIIIYNGTKEGIVRRWTAQRS